jgi:hypothetical protein
MSDTGQWQNTFDPNSINDQTDAVAKTEQERKARALLYSHNKKANKAELTLPLNITLAPALNVNLVDPQGIIGGFGFSQGKWGIDSVKIIFGQSGGTTIIQLHQCLNYGSAGAVTTSVPAAPAAAPNPSAQEIDAISPASYQNPPLSAQELDTPNINP